MTRDLVVATRDTTLREVAIMMKEEDTGVIPVVDYESNGGNGRSIPKQETTSETMTREIFREANSLGWSLIATSWYARSLKAKTAILLVLKK